MTRSIFSLLFLFAFAVSAQAHLCNPEEQFTQTGIWQRVGSFPGEDCSGECYPAGGSICRVMPEGSRRWYDLYQRKVTLMDGCRRVLEERVEDARQEIGCFTR